MDGLTKTALEKGSFHPKKAARWACLETVAH